MEFISKDLQKYLMENGLEYTKKDEIVLSGLEQRDIFFERVMATEENIDTVEIAEAVINVTEKPQT